MPPSIPTRSRAQRGVRSLAHKPSPCVCATYCDPTRLSAFVPQSSLRVRALVIQIDPLNQCDWGTEVTYPPLCYRDDPVAEAEFANTTRWVRVVGEDAAPRSSLVRWWYPTGESAGTLKEGFKLGYTPKPDLNYPILLDHFDQRDYQDRVDLFCSKSDIIASYSKFIQLFVITEHILTGEARSGADEGPPFRYMMQCRRLTAGPRLNAPLRCPTSASRSTAAYPRWTAACCSQRRRRGSSCGTAQARYSRGRSAAASRASRRTWRWCSTSRPSC